MSKKKHTVVPAALHHELSEYSALLRSLRTNHIQDLSSQILPPTHAVSSSSLAPTPTREGSFDENERDDAEEGAVGGSSSSQAKREADLWTRWPLLEGDAPVPEWDLEQEVRYVALRTLKEVNPSHSQLLQPKLSQHSAHITSEDTDDAVLHDLGLDLDFELEATLDAILPYLASSTHSFLTSALEAIQAQKPLAPKSMANRFAPVSWERVLSIAESEGLGEREDIVRIEEMLSGIYQGSQTGGTNTLLERERERSEVPRRGTGEFMRRRREAKAGFSDDCFLDLPAASQEPGATRGTSVQPEEDLEEDSDPPQPNTPPGPMTRSRKRRMKPEDPYITSFSILK